MRDYGNLSGGCRKGTVSYSMRTHQQCKSLDTSWYLFLISNAAFANEAQRAPLIPKEENVVVVVP